MGCYIDLKLAQLVILDRVPTSVTSTEYNYPYIIIQLEPYILPMAIASNKIFSIGDVPKVNVSMKFYISHIKNVPDQKCFQNKYISKDLSITYQRFYRSKMFPK